MLELFNHIFHLDFDWLFANYKASIYTILFLVIFVETGLVAMPFLPGDSLLFTAGLLTRQATENGNHLDLATVLGLLVIAAILGDNVNYWIGRTVGLRVFHIKIKGKPIVKQEYLDKTHAFYEQYGTKAIIMARFVPFVRTFAPFAAGIGKMDYKKFFGFDVLGGTLWICSLTLAGHLLGEVEFIRKHIDMVCLGIIFISVVPVILGVIRGKKDAA